MVRKDIERKGKSDETGSIVQLQYRRRRTILISTVLFLIFFLLIFGILALTKGKYLLAVFDISSSFIMALILFIFKKKDNYISSRNIMIAIISVAFLYLFAGEGIESGSYLWTLTYPVYTIFFIGAGIGLNLSLTFLGVEILIHFSGLFPLRFQPEFLFRYISVFLAILMISYIIEKIREDNLFRLNKINKRLKSTIGKLIKSQEALTASEGKYRTLVERGNDGILILKDEIIVYSNPQFCRMLGITEKKILNARIKKFIFKDNYRELQGFLNPKKKDTKNIRTLETIFIDSSKNRIDVEIKRTYIDFFNESSQLLFIRDISERKKFEREKIKYSKMETFRTVSDGITHDFNNLLTIIMGNTELARLNLSSDKKLISNLRKIEEASERAEKLIKQLLTFSTDATLVMSREYIQDMIPEILDSFEEFKNVKFDLTIEKNLWPVRCDRDRVSIAVSNIILNGIEAMEFSGKIGIELKKIPDIRKYDDKLKRGNYILIGISDTGRGIGGKYIDRIFDPYFSTKKSVTQKGRGLGLTIANRVIINHNGLIKVFSTPGKGSTMAILLPAEPDEG